MKKADFLLLTCLVVFFTANSMKAQMVTQNSTGDFKIKDQVNWAEFLSRHDLIWKKLPTRWGEGAFVGNGLQCLKACDPLSIEASGALNLCVQSLQNGLMKELKGEYATAWTIVPYANGSKILYLDVGFSKNIGAAGEEAMASVNSAMDTGMEKLRFTHREWWHRYYPASFVSVPNMRVESFYWIQMYKFACVTRANRPPIHPMGPWYINVPCPYHVWDYNIQASYWPLLGENRIELGESLYRFLDDNLENFQRIASDKPKEPWGLTMVGGENLEGPWTTPYVANLTFVMHNYWLLYRHTLDDLRLRRCLFPLLKANMAIFMHANLV